jgi:hypothetical protein
MSSVSSYFSQVPAHIGFYRVVDSTVTAYLSSSNTGNSVRTTDITSGTASFTAGSLFRDMGKYVTVVNASGYALNKYALVHYVVSGDSSEGAGLLNFATHFVRIWSADTATYPVHVARLG